MNKQTKYKQTEIGEIPEEWELTTLGNLADITSSKRIFASDYLSEGVLFYRGKEIVEKNSGSSISSELFISENKFQEIKNKFGVPQENDILLTSVGTLGIPYRVTKDDRFYFKDGNLTWFRNLDKSSSEYIYHWLNSDFGKRRLLEKSIGSTQQALTIVALKSIYIELPPANERSQITSILSSLDEKIELNRKMNKTLEEIGKALFKHWFVDFEFPNEDGKPYKSSDGEMVESELGEIPKGWKIRTLPEVAHIQKGLSYKGKDLSESSDTALVGLKCIERGGGFRKDGFKYYDGVYKDEHVLKPGDLIVAMTDLTQAADVIGKPAIVPIIPQIETLVASLDLSIIKPKKDGFDEYYFYLLLTRQESQDFLYGYTNGSTVLHLSIKGLKEFKLLVPENSILIEFQKILQPIRKKLKSLDAETSYLQLLRDSLLPRLMSGKLRV